MKEDTYFTMYWEDFKTLLIKKGFKIALSYTFDNNKNEAIIYYQPKKGWVLFATSYGDKINGGSLHSEIQAKEGEDNASTIWCNLSTGGLIKGTGNIYESTLDVREGLFNKLAILESAGIFLTKWVSKNRFLWFVDFRESESPSASYSDITNSKINKCPLEFKEILGVRNEMEKS